MTRVEFRDMFARLARQLQHADAGEAVVRAYYEGLRDLEPELLHAAAARISRTVERFPTTSGWRAATETIRRERLDAQRPHMRQAPDPLCPLCDDTGWQPVDVVERGHAVRRVMPCRCRAQRRRELLGRAPQSARTRVAEPPDRKAWTEVRVPVTPLGDRRTDRSFGRFARAETPPMATGKALTVTADTSFRATERMSKREWRTPEGAGDRSSPPDG